LSRCLVVKFNLSILAAFLRDPSMLGRACFCQFLQLPDKFPISAHHLVWEASESDEQLMTCADPRLTLSVECVLESQVGRGICHDMRYHHQLGLCTPENGRTHSRQAFSSWRKQTHKSNVLGPFFFLLCLRDHRMHLPTIKACLKRASSIAQNQHNRGLTK
jgi:hypothetical protein